MLNSFPVWKYVLLAAIIFIGTIYVLPNFYPEDPSIQITSTYNVNINEKKLVKIENILQQENIIIKSIILRKGIIFIRFNSIDTQLHACEVLKRKLNNQYIVSLNFSPTTPGWLTTLNIKPMKLGLDLRGGVYFLMEIDSDIIFRKLQEQNIISLRNYLNKKGIPYISICKTSYYGINILFIDTITRDLIMDYLNKYHHDLVVFSDKKQIQVTMTSSLEEAREYAMKKNITILRNRVNQIGVSDPLVQRQGVNQIIIELPGIQDIFHAKEILGSTAMLEFRLVKTDLDQSIFKSDYIPDDLEIKQTHFGQPILLDKHAILNGDHIINSTYSQDEYNQPQINIMLDNTGGDIMFNFTKKNIGKQIAILLIEYKDSGKKDSSGRTILVKKEEIISIANIQSYLDKNFRITGINNRKEARHLSLLIQSGTLTTPMQIVEEKTIGPTLGAKNIKQGLEACLVALLSSSLFMILFYKEFGLIAIIALIINLELIVAAMSLLPGATLTMPGIAGIVLTLSVAIDANILINERIKEEISNGCSVKMAIYEGYKRVFSCIFDANLTTLIKVIVLYVIGTGPIKGFAITTAIGTVTSMFTSVICTRSIIDLFYGGKKRIKKISI